MLRVRLTPATSMFRKIAAALSIEGSSSGDSALERIDQWKSMVPEGATAEFVAKSAEDKDMN